MIQLHQLRPLHKPKKKKRIGRGGKHGTYSGRGIKGQKARAGRKLKPVIRDLIKRYPKLRGYRFNSKIRNLKLETAIVNLDTLERKFESGEKVTPKILVEKKIVDKIKGKVPKIKILGKGKLTKKLIIESCQVSKSAREKIEEVGGLIK